MYIKLSLRNIKRSFKNYMIYFLTIALGICMFYVFNTIQAQTKNMVMSEYQSEIIQILSWVMAVISLFVIIILAFLILFANRFLLKTRTKELAVYLVLGMEKKQVSTILFMESFGIGICALAGGLVGGVILSQLLSVITAHFFGMAIENFTFIFSFNAFQKTLLYFIGILFTAALFNGMVMRKYQLLDLLQYEKKNELNPVKKLGRFLCIFLISLFMIGFAYFLCLNDLWMTSLPFFCLTAALGSAGTFLFFKSVSGFLLSIMLRNKKRYLKDLNMFVMRQIGSNIRTAYISISLISLMIVMTIGALATGIGMQQALKSNLENGTPFDASFFVWDKKELTKDMEEMGFDFNKVSADQWEFYEYESLFTTDDFLNLESYSSGYDRKIPMIKESDYNALAVMMGEQTIALGEESCLFVSDVGHYKENRDRFKPLRVRLKNREPIEVNGTRLFPLEEKTIKFSFETTPFQNNLLIFVVPDSVILNAPVVRTILNIEYKEPKEEAIHYLNQWKKYDFSDFPVIVTTKEEARDSIMGLGAILSYIGIYIGLIFLVCSAAVLSLQQLSQSADNKGRFELLGKMGAEEKMVKRALFKQIGIYFLMPFVLAIIHSFFIIGSIYPMILKFGHLDGFSFLAGTSMIVLFIYGGYFLCTYHCAKRMLPRF